MAASDAAVWQVTPPPAWPVAPKYMSFSTLTELEACPRRWALSAAAYPQVWDHQGYPQPALPAALEGTVTHVALETITRALSDRGCPSVDDASATVVLKELGGFTSVVGKSIERTLERYASNPRAASALDRIQRHLTGRTAELRSRVQGFLSRSRLEPPPRNAPIPRGTDKKREYRGALPRGSHSEVQLEVEELHWRGVVDLLTLSETTCEIRDFKTGEPKEEHELQLHVYALLWWLDRARNPTGRLADRLVVSYDSGDVRMTVPGARALQALREKLSARRAAAIAALEDEPPEARPSAANCGFCSVRHLCDAYWEDSVPCERQEKFADLQLELKGRHATTSWDGVVESCSGLARGSRIVLRTIGLPFELRTGQRLRVLNVRVSAPIEEPADDVQVPAVASMGAASEAFLLSSQAAVPVVAVEGAHL